MPDGLDGLKKDVMEYLEIKLDIIRLHIAENLSRVFRNTVTVIVTGYFLFLILLFLSFAAGYFIGSLLDSVEGGFLCVAAFYFLMLLIFLLFRKQIVDRPVIRAMVSLLFPKYRDDEKK